MNKLHGIALKRKAKKGGPPQNEVAGQNGPVTQIQQLTEGNPTRGLKGSGDPETERNLEDLEGSEESPKKTPLRILRGSRKEESEDKEPEGYEELDQIPTDLPLEEYTIRGHRCPDTDGPEKDETWRSETWEFTRFMKRHPNLRDLTGAQAANIIPWHLTDFDEDEQFQIVNEWDTIRYVAGEGPLNKALALALKFPVPRKTNLTRRFTRYAEFLSLAGWLQVVVGEENEIYLPHHKVAGIFGCDRGMIHNLTRAAITEGYLTVVKPHSAHAATRYQFHLDKFPGHFRERFVRS